MPRRAVLVVDDLARSGRALVKELLEAGVHARSVADLADVKRAMMPPYPRAIVLITEPGSGEESLAYCRELKASAETRAVIVVMVTGGAGLPPAVSKLGPNISVRAHEDDLKFLCGRIKGAIRLAGRA